MVVNVEPNINSVLNQFEIRGDFAAVAPYGSGHINDTYCAAFSWMPAAAPRHSTANRISTFSSGSGRCNEKTFSELHPIWLHRFKASPTAKGVC